MGLAANANESIAAILQRALGRALARGAGHAGDLTPEKIAAMEHEASQKEENDKLLPDEDASPTAGRRFTRA